MERITFFERYRISVDDAGNPREMSRSGAAVTYRAVDLQSGDPVALKVIPIGSVSAESRDELQERARSTQHVEHENVARLLAFIPDKDDYVFVSEITHGETLAQWVATHGPLAPDATLRVALQVVSGLQAAAFHGLTHAAIEPSNIMIVPGVASDGGWPAIKLLNLDSAGVPIVSPEQHAPLVGTAAAPQFAAPEQLHSGIADFRSEIYSLGATMCFMLTGLAPLGVRADGEAGEAKLPANLRRLPRNVRELLLDMLRPNPEDRPQDPVAFAERIRLVLGSLERRRPSRRAAQPPPVAPVMPFQYRRPPSFIRPIAIAAGIVVLAAIATLLIAQPIRAIWRRHHDVTQIGVPVGVPDAQASPAAIVQSSPPQPTASAPQIATAKIETPAQEQPHAPANDAKITSASPPAPSATTEAENAQVAENESAGSGATNSANATTPVRPSADSAADNRVAENQRTTEPAAPPQASSQAAPAGSGDGRVASTASSVGEQAAASPPRRSTSKIASSSTHADSNPPDEANGSSVAPARNTESTRPRVAENQASNEAASPAESPSQTAPATQSAAAENSDGRVAETTTSGNDQQQAAATPSRVRTTKKVATNTNRRESNPGHEPGKPPQAQRETQTARFVGTTRNGEWIFEAPSGDAILDLPSDDQGRRDSRRRRHRREEVRPEVVPAEPVQPEVRRALPPDQDE